MASHSDSDPANTGQQDSGWSTKTRLILAAIGLVGFFALYLIAIYGLPRWWTNFITGITNESVTTSWLLGAVIGFAFALLPILVFLMGLRLRKSWKGIIGWLVVAIVVALPNIMTLGVRFGSGNAAKTAWTKLSNEAPGFTVASYVGIALGVGVGLWVAWVTVSRRRAKHKAEQLAAQQAQASQTASASASSAASAPSAGDTAIDHGYGDDHNSNGHDSGDDHSGDDDSGDDDSGISASAGTSAAESADHAHEADSGASSDAWNEASDGADSGDGGAGGD